MELLSTILFRDFICNVAFRLCSGLKNGSYYYHHVSSMIVAVAAMVVINAFWFSYFSLPGAFICIVPACLLLLMVLLALLPKRTKSVHLWENIVQISWVGVAIYLGADLIQLGCASLTGVWLFNWAIRYMEARYYLTTVDYLSQRTVHFTRWEAMLALWHTNSAVLKKSRKGNWFTLWTFSGRTKTLLGIAAACTAIVCYSMKIHFNVYDLIDML